MPSRRSSPFLAFTTVGLMVIALLFVGLSSAHVGPFKLLTDSATATEQGQPPPIVDPTSTFEGANFYWSGSNHSVAQWTVTPEVDQVGPDAYYYGYSFQLSGGSIGYAGLQGDENGKRAIFSIWDADGATGPQKAQPFGGEGIGYQTIISYPWVAGHGYQFQLSRGASDTTGNWWQVSVTDTASAVRSDIGQIKVSPAWGGLTSAMSVWTERYGGPKDCSQTHYTSVSFTDLTVDGTPPNSHQGYLANRCPVSRITEIPGGIRHEAAIGNPTSNQ